MVETEYTYKSIKDEKKSQGFEIVVIVRTGGSVCMCVPVEIVRYSISGIEKQKHHYSLHRIFTFGTNRHYSDNRL